VLPASDSPAGPPGGCGGGAQGSRAITAPARDRFCVCCLSLPQHWGQACYGRRPCAGVFSAPLAAAAPLPAFTPRSRALARRSRCQHGFHAPGPAHAATEVTLRRPSGRPGSAQAAGPACRSCHPVFPGRRLVHPVARSNFSRGSATSSLLYAGQQHRVPIQSWSGHASYRQPLGVVRLGRGRFPWQGAYPPRSPASGTPASPA